MEPIVQNPTPSVSFTINWGLHAMLRLLANYREDFNTVLEVGAGDGEHARLFRYFGKDVYTIDYQKDADYVGDFISVDIDKQFDLIWCSHVIEHQRNVGLFLDKIYSCLKPDGILAITAPVHPRERIVSGHVTSWTPHLLCYNLVLAGFDCKDAEMFHVGELSVILRKKSAIGPDINCPAAICDISELQQFFPAQVQEKSEWTVTVHRWSTNYSFPLPGDEPIEILSGFLPGGRTTIV
jgi:SAM-dependent methyltransferase